MGHRELSFIQYASGEQFQHEIEKCCDLAVEKTRQYKNELKTLELAHEALVNYKFTSDSLWGNYHKGTVAGLIDDAKSMETHYEKLLKVEHDIEWVGELKERTRILLDLSSDLSKFRNEIAQICNVSRKLKKLDACDLNPIKMGTPIRTNF